MSIPSSLTPLFNSGAAGGLQIERSIRFNSADSAYLSRTPGTASNRTTYTFSCWAKRATLTVRQMVFSATNVSDADALYFHEDNTLRFNQKDGLDSNLITTQVFRDASAWYHLLVSVDTTQGTSSNRIKLYVNGTQITTFSTATYPSSSYTGGVNNTVAHNIGRRSSASDNYLSAYLANIHFIDGQALTPSSFTETDATTGQLIPKTYSGSYGTNGYNLLFADNSSNTASTLGKDTSGLGNNFTPNNLSVTAGVGNDSLVDSPTNYGTDTAVGGEVRGNYCTWNPLAIGSVITASNGNLDFSSSSSASFGSVLGTIGLSSGKWYWEVTMNAPRSAVGVAKNNVALSTNVANDANAWMYQWTGNKSNNGTETAYGATYTTNDIVGVAFDADNATLTFYKNGSSQGQAYSGLTSGPYFPIGSDQSSGDTGAGSANFGQRAFAYQTPGTNRPAATFKTLCTQNLPAPLVTKSSSVFDVITYTGTGSSLTLPNGSSTPTSIAFTPDFVWLKGRSGATDHALYDVVRGVQKDLVSNSTAAETTQTTGLTAFGTNTFTVGSLAKLNTTSATYVAWAWDAGTSTVSNPDGSIISQVRANVTAGFSVITYTGTGVNATVGHGLGVAPAFYITKRRDNAAFGNWTVYHSSVGTQALELNGGGAAFSDSTRWPSAATSTVFNIGSNGNVNTSSGTYVAYVFAPVVGNSSFGSYVGNGSADGPFVYLGFRARWIMLKKTDTSSDWWIYDTARQNYNVMGPILYANISDAEFATDASVFGRDLLSNGFKVRNAHVTVNGNGATYIYAAFAEAPFNYARAR